MPHLVARNLPWAAPLVDSSGRITKEWLHVFIDFLTLIEGDSKGAHIKWGEGDPEGSESANIGSVFLRVDGGALTTLYVKESGDGTNTGWVAK